MRISAKRSKTKHIKQGLSFKKDYTEKHHIHTDICTYIYIYVNCQGQKYHYADNNAHRTKGSFNLSLQKES